MDRDTATAVTDEAREPGTTSGDPSAGTEPGAPEPGARTEPRAPEPGAPLEPGDDLAAGLALSGTTFADQPTLTADEVQLGYDGLLVVDRLSVSIPPGEISVIVGANASGKSTLLRGLARLLKPKSGAVLLDGQAIHRMRTREVATRLGMLPQQPIAPDGITVVDLVGRGRHPHQRWFRQWSASDEAVVEEALRATGLDDLGDRPVDELSGGQRQRVWIALALAQGTPLMLLDEPTTFLDLAHQVEVLDLLADLNERESRTIVLVLHDLNLACRYAHQLLVMKQGTIVAQGPPNEVITADLVEDVFALRCEVIPDPLTATPRIIPIPARRPPAMPPRA